MKYDIVFNGCKKVSSGLNKSILFSIIIFLIVITYSIHANMIDKGIDLSYQFIENKGQYIDENSDIVSDVKFVLNNGHKSIYIKANAISFLNYIPTPDSSIFDIDVQEMNFAGCNQNIEISGIERSPDYINYYLPHCPDGILNVYKYGRIEYKNIYDNIDFQLYINDNNELQYDFIVNPGGDPNDICINMSNTDSVVLMNSDLVVKSSGNNIKHQSPYTYQIVENKKKEIKSRFRIMDDNSISFFVDEYDRTKQLIIDPVIREWGTFFGGMYEDELRSIAYDSHDNIVACGFSSSEYQIATNNAYQKDINGITDAIIIKLDDNGNRIWSTYYGGSEIDMGAYLAIDNADNIFISGSTLSDDVIGDGGYQPSNNGSYDCFLAKFNPSGHRIWGTFYGGNKNDNPFVSVGITYGKFALDKNSNIYLSGISISDDNIIGEDGWQPNIDSSKLYDCFLAKFDENGNRVWGTYYGGNGNDWLHDIGLDHDDNIIIGGATASTQSFASEDAWQNVSIMLGLPMFLAKFNSENGERIWGTYFYEEDYSTLLNDLDIDSNGMIYFVGMTNSNNLGIGNNIGINYPGYDYILGKFSNNGKPIWTTYIGGEKRDYPTNINIDNSGKYLYISGITQSIDFPVRAAIQNDLRGWRDNVLLKFDTTGRYIWGTYYGGYSNNEEFNDVAWDMDVNENKQVAMAGNTSSAEVFGFDGFQPNYGGGVMDSWIAMFQDNSIIISEESTNLYCPGFEIEILFTINKELNESIDLSAFLWDANGDYFDRIIIGSFQVRNSGTLKANIPEDISPGSYNLTLDGAENYITITINPKPIPLIFGPAYICSKVTQTFSCNLQDDYTYEWKSNFGEIIGEDDKKDYKISWYDSGIDTLALTVTNENTGCTNSTTMEVQIDIWDSQIFGNRLVCYGDYQQVYFNNLKGLQKKWQVSGGEIIDGQTTDTITVNWTSPGSNQLSLILMNPNGGCRDTSTINILIDEFPVPEPQINGRIAVCENELQTYYISKDNVDNTVEWSVKGGTIQGSNTEESVTVLWSEDVKASIFVTESTPAGCSGSDEMTVYINCYGADIFGIFDVCVGGVYKYRTQHIPGTSNIWTAKPGGEVLSGRLLDTVNVLWSQSGTKLLGLAKITQTQYGTCTKPISRLIDNSTELSVFDIPEIEYDPKEQYEKTISIPIMIEKPGCLSFIGEQVNVTAKVRLKKSLFLPLSTTTQSYEDDENDIWRIITTKAPVKQLDEAGVLLEITGYALLGDTMSSPIIIESMEWDGITINRHSKNGSLRMKNINEYGGKRMLKKKKMSLMKIYPIPFSNELNLLIESQQEMDASFKIYSVLGEEVFSKNILLHTGSQEILLKLSNKLSDGIYRVVVDNYETVISENVIIRN